jgi:putative CocE/NonD family hydrolase
MNKTIALVAILIAPGHAAFAETGTEAGERESRPGQYTGYSEPRFREWMLTSEYITVRDGTRLAADIYRPAVDGKPTDERLPVIWIHTPYRRAYLDADGKRVSIVERFWLLEILKYGYVVAAVDTRGRGASFGARRGFLDRTEAQDAYDLTEWFAEQPFSDGNVGITGCSYVGASTLHAATVAPPHLKAIAPGCFGFDAYGFVSRGGITAQFNTRPEDPEKDYGYGVLPVDEDTDGSMLAAALEIHKKGTPMAELWRGMPFRDDVSPLVGTRFWEETSAASYTDVIEKSGVGIFMWGNWLDEGSFEVVLAYNNLDNERRLWMGGWGHCQIGDFPMGTELLRFFDHYLKRIDNGWDREPPIYYYTIGAAEDDRWTGAASWPPAASTIELFPRGEAAPGVPGRLAREPDRATQASDEFTVDYQPVCAADVDMYFMFWPCVIEDHGLSYTTAALAADLHIAGHPVVDLQVSSTTPDADLFVYLEDVAPDGAISIFTHGRLRMSHSGENEAPFDNFMGLPYHRGNRSDVMDLTSGELVRMRLDLLPTSIIIKAGHRLRLTVAGADPRQRSRSVVFDPPPVITLHSQGESFSKLLLPLVTPLVTDGEQ